MTEIIGVTFIVVGLFLDILGCIGLNRLPDVYSRLQATSKCITLGTSCILLGTFILKGISTTGVKALLLMVFLLLTAPVTVHALARGAHKSGTKLWKNSVCDKYAEDDK